MRSTRLRKAGIRQAHETIEAMADLLQGKRPPVCWLSRSGSAAQIQAALDRLYPTPHPDNLTL